MNPRKAFASRIESITKWFRHQTDDDRRMASVGDIVDSVVIQDAMTGDLIRLTPGRFGDFKIERKATR